MVISSFPILKTQRLTLRPFSLDDAKTVQKLAGDPQIAATTATIPHPYLDGMAEDWISKHQDWFQKGVSVDWAIIQNSDQQLVGNISLMIHPSNQRAEVGYWMGVNFWNHGFCTEAMQKVIEYAFEVRNLNKITCRHMHINPASGKVMLKNGLKQEGVLREEIFKNGKFFDTIVYGLLKSEWVKR